jgi:hypothetical protein
VHTRRQTNPTWLREHDHALTVACPLPPRGCNAQPGRPCTTRDGRVIEAPAHSLRLRAADRANPEGKPAAEQAPAAEVQPVRHLVLAEQVRRDLASHVEPCGRCHRSIVWATNARGDRVPVDSQPSPSSGGRLATLHVDDRGVRVVLLSPGQVIGARAAGQRLYAPHRETCLYGHLWSRHRD